ncbi:MAG: hypothetical protein PHS45_04330 [Bacilli bacterium]|nr:hypothetical protein [Bacilli bacterium]
MMKDLLIKEYINRLNTNDINEFAKKVGITLEDEETLIIFNCLKKYWRTFLYGNPKGILNDLKLKLKDETYNKIEQLYIQAKSKIF